MAVIDGTPQDDVLSGTVGNDTINGSGGNDTLIGADSAGGGGGDDALIGGTSGTFEGDRDKADYSGSDTGIGITVTMTGNADLGLSTVSGDSSIGKDTLTSIEWVIGTSYDDTYTADPSFVSGTHYHYSLSNLAFVGTDTINFFQGGLGNDVITGNGNTRIVYSDAASGITVDLSGENSGGTGTVIKNDGAGTSYTDTVSGIGSVVGTAFADSMTGSNADEMFIGGQGDDTINGGGGNDWAGYGNDIAAVTVDLANKTATDGWGNTDTLVNIGRITGSAFDDKLIGDSGDNWIRGNAGNDTIIGGGGNDYADYVNDISSVVVDLAAGTATDGWGNTDTLIGIDRVRGSFFDDKLSGDANSNVFIGLQGNDTFIGGGGSDYVSYAEDIAGVTVDLGTGTATDGWGTTDTLSGIGNVIGSAFNDTLTGNGGTNFIRGEAGNDTLNGGGGSDYVDYKDDISGVSVDLSLGTATDGWGNTDTLSNFENIRGSAFNDVLTGDGNTNFLRGMAGNDTLNGGGGIDWASYFNDISGVTANLGTGSATDGWGNTDTLLSIQNIDGSSFNDVLIGDSGSNTLKGEGGSDRLVGAGGNDTLIGGAGGVFEGDLDKADYSGGNGSITVHMVGGDAATTASTVTNATGGNDTLKSVEWVIGSALGDTYTADNNFVSGSHYFYLANTFSYGGSGALNFFQGGAGNDTINGNGITRVVYSDATAGITADLQAGTITGDSSVGTDTVSGIGSIVGTAFADKMTGTTANEIFDGGDGADTIDGGGGNDWASYRGDIAGVTVDLGAGTATDGWGKTDSLSNIDRIIGSAFADTLTGNGGDNWIRGNAGNDTIDGGGGGKDYADYSDDIAGVTVDLAAGTATDGWGNTDTLLNIERTRGSFFNDTLTGDGGNNLFIGLAGNDTFDGGGGADYVSYGEDIAGVTVNLATGTATDGWGGTDTLLNIKNVIGSGFDDSLTGNSGNNFLRGEAGNDTIDGGGGFGDFVDYSDDISAVTVNLATGTATDGWGNTDTLLNLENIRGSAFADTLTGNGGNNFLRGLAGNDTLDGGGNSSIGDYADYYDDISAVTVNLATGTATDGWGNTDTLLNIENIRGSAFADTLTGDSGNNQFRGLAGDDTFNGGGGSDWANYQSDIAGVSVDLLGGTATDSWGGTDTLISIENADGSNFNDGLVGDNANNQLLGEAGDDVFTGLGGNDTMDGGSGNDTAVYIGPRTSYSITRSGGVVTVTDLDGAANGNDGTDTLTHFERLAFNDPSGPSLVTLNPRNDFNGDGSSELLWANQNGALAQWQLNGSAYVSGTVFGGASSEWSIVGQADFNGDSKYDLLWQNTNGLLGEWQLDGSTYIDGGVIAGPAGTGWSLAAVSDFNGDSLADILWKNSNGLLSEWQMAGTAYIGGGVFSGPGTGWTLAGSGDFNGDGRADLLWQNGSSFQEWQMNGTSTIAVDTFTGPSGWTLKGIADFNGDTKADLLWQKNDLLAEWYMDGATYIGGGVLAAADSNWSLAGLADFNGDGKTDILRKNINNGSLGEWQMDGITYKSGGVLAAPGAPGWNLVNNGQLVA